MAELYDFWQEAPQLFYVEAEGARTNGKYPDERPITLDFVNHQSGDFCVSVYLPGSGIVGITPGPYQNEWELMDGMRLHAALRGNGTLDKVTVCEVSYAGGTLSSQWQEFCFPVTANLATEIRFHFSETTQVQFDEVYFESETAVLGVTKKPISQRIREAAESRERRICEAYRKGLENPFYEIIKPFAKLYFGEKVDEANREIVEILTAPPGKTERLDFYDTWSLLAPAYLYRLYFNFGPEGTVAANRLFPETVSVILDLLWKLTVHKNDIHTAQLSTWWLFGSENHDINAKTASLLSSLIFMNHPEYAGRQYPDTGTGGGEGYWFRKDKSWIENQGPCGRKEPDAAPGKTPEEHYQAWVKFWLAFFQERTKKGFFVEVASPSYMKWTMTFLTDIYDYCGNAELKATAKQFLDLVWTDWAQDALSGRRGGAKTRRYDWVGEYDAMYTMAAYLLGGEGNGVHAYYNSLLSEYSLPEHVWKMALGRERLGEYEYISRKPGEERPYFPRPAGTERGLLCDTDSRLVRYSYVTPHYIMGTQMDHPLAIHSHLSNEMRWQGLIFSSNPHALVFPVCISEDGERIHKPYRSVQHKTVLLTQQARSYMHVDPDWFPDKTMDSQEFGVAITAPPDEVLEKAGAVFLRYGKANVMLRPAIGTYSWNEDRTFMKFDDRFDVAVIETGTGTFQEFIGQVMKKSRLMIGETVVSGWYTVTYSGISGDILYFNASNNEPPRVNNAVVDYEPAFTFHSPYLRGRYNKEEICVTDPEDT